MSWLGRFFRDKRKSVRKASPRSVTLSVERLEDRLAPVVGAYAVPDAIAPLVPMQPASQYDGVVRLVGRGSGSLITTGATGLGSGHEILTAAHVMPLGGVVPVRFDLQRAGTPVQVLINVPANVVGGAQYQIRHSGFAFPLNDIGLTLLVDQVTPAPDRLLVAPYTAQQYTLYAGAPPEVGQQFTMVGYGKTGTGATGEAMASGTKRVGLNRFDSSGVPLDPTYTMDLMYDFDRLDDPGGLPNIDPMNVRYGIANAGLGAAEAMQALGDSGGAAFVGANVLAGVLSARKHPGMPPDIDAVENSSFGELGLITNVSMTIGDAALQAVLNPGGGAKYHLVLDMNQQVVGRDGVAENITIAAQRSADGLNVELLVSGSGAGSLNGTYYSAPCATIASLTIRGGPDNETIRVIGDPNVGVITIDGRGGNNTIVVGDAAIGNLNEVRSDINIENSAGGTNSLEVNDVAATVNTTFTLTADILDWGAAARIIFNNITNLKLNAGDHNDTINVQETNAATTTTISTGNGFNIVRVGSANGNTSTLDKILGNVIVNGCGGTDSLRVNDRGSMAAQAYTVTNETVQRGAGATISYDCMAFVQVNGGSGGNTIAVKSTATGTDTSIYSGAGKDVITVGSGAANSTLDDIDGPLLVAGEGPLTLDGRTGDNEIIIDDSGSPAGTQYTSTDISVTRVGANDHDYTLEFAPDSLRQCPASHGRAGKQGRGTQRASRRTGPHRDREQR